MRGRKNLQTQTKKVDPTRKRKRAKKIRANINFTECPECKKHVTHDEEHCLDYCTNCGLVTRASLQYTGLRKAKYPYHLLIW